MYQLYCVMKCFGNVKAELIENYEDRELAIRQTVAMWLENDRPVTCILMKGDDVIVNFCSMMTGSGEQDAVCVFESDRCVANDYTGLAYDYVDGKIVSTSGFRNGKPIKIHHNW